MNYPNDILPSNKKFGYFFTVFFLIAFLYLIYSNFVIAGFVMFIISAIFLIITIINAKMLLPLNKIWMHLGILLGTIITPIVLGIIFFGLFTPYGIVMRLMGRDELRLKLEKKNNHWIIRPKNYPQTNFERQF